MGLHINEVRTQKAKGLMNLYENGNSFGFDVPLLEVINSPDQLSYLRRFFVSEELFARPCPLTPRHGFVDSRKVHGLEEIRKVLEEAKAADPDAELILMAPIDAKCSGVWTPGLMVMGPGNDGATAGRGAKSIEVTGELVTEKERGRAGVKSSPYMEFVVTQQDWVNLVQLRDGPPIPQGVKDFIPAPILVTEVVKIPEPLEERPDLLKWEQMAKTFQPGTVIYHPNGGLADHYSVHCITRWKFDGVNIPVMTTREPKVGEMLEVCTPPAPEPDVEELRRGFKLAVQRKFDDPKGSMGWRLCGYAMLGGVHNAAVWMGKQDRLIGYGMGMAYRLCHTACMGELRHRFLKEIGLEEMVSRNDVYGKFFNKTFPARSLLQNSIRLFYDESVNWGGNFGGPKWGEFAWVGVKLYNAVAARDYKKAMDEYNMLVNMAHNNGWAFNKFMDKLEMDRSAQAGAYPVVMGMSLYMELLQGERKFNVPEWGKLQEPMVVGEVTVRHPVRAQVKVETSDKSGAKVVFLQIGWDVGARTTAHPIIVPDNVLKIIEKALGDENNTFLTTSMNGKGSRYVALVQDGVEWNIVYDGKAEWVVSIPDQQVKEQKQIVFPDMVVTPPSVLKEQKRKEKLKQEVQKNPVPKAKIVDKIEVGDWVKCNDPSHPGLKEFMVVKVGPLSPNFGEDKLYYGKPKGGVHSSGMVGCSGKMIEKIPVPSIPEPVPEPKPKKKSKAKKTYPEWAQLTTTGWGGDVTVTIDTATELGKMLQASYQPELEMYGAKGTDMDDLPKDVVCVCGEDSGNHYATKPHGIEGKCDGFKMSKLSK